MVRATPQHLRARALTYLMYGRKDQEIRLLVQSPDGPERTVDVRCVLPPFGEGSAVERRHESLPEKIAELRPGIVYVDLARITDEDFKNALGRLAAAKGVVFDLRVHPGNLWIGFLQHLTDQPLYSPQWLVPILSHPDQRDISWVRYRFYLPPLAPRIRGKLAFLIGAETFSYGEELTGFVDAPKLGPLVGGPTAGVNGNTNAFELPGNYRIIWTGMKVLKQDGSRHHGVGFQPTIPVFPTRRGLAAGKDEVLERALDAVE